MLKRRLGTAALLLALVGAACGGGDQAATDDDASVLGLVIERSTTTTVAPTTTTAATDAAAAAEDDPAPVTPAPKPAPASIEVDYQPAEGSEATATIEGPNGTHTKSLSSGAAIFGSLPAGLYSITVTVDTPSDDPSVGDARHILNGYSIEVGPGDHATFTCDDANGCSGVLNA